MTRRRLAPVSFAPGALALVAACASSPERPAAPPIAGARPADHLIEPGETHFARLWQVTKGGENAEGYWSFSGDRLALQRRFGEQKCDRIFVTDPRGSDRSGLAPLAPVSSGKGVTTCSYFLPGDREVLFASTQAFMEECPPKVDYSEGYVWMLWPEYDLWVHDLATGAERRLTDGFGYDAEATVSPRGDRIVFTSLRTGDPELFTCDLEGADVRQVTDSVGYDGGAFFSHDGQRLIFRATIFQPDGEDGDRATYAKLIGENKIRPHLLELFACDADGSNRRQVTSIGGANFAPYFFPDDSRVIFATNHHDASGRKFDLFAVDLDGSDLEAITTYDGFDSFPMFSPDGRWLAFASNRGGTEPGETNLFVAQWR